MGFAEDMTVFFDTGGFAVPAVWGSLTASVIFDAPTQDVLGGRALSDDYTATLPVASLPGIARGASITVDGVAYVVREVRILDDGRLKALSLAKP